jgi:tetratricopeptide (TPR) repeat protein
MALHGKYHGTNEIRRYNAKAMNVKSRPALFLPLILLLFGVTIQVHVTDLERQSYYEQAYRWQPWRHDLLEKAGFFAAEQGDPQTAIAFFLRTRQQDSLTTPGRLALAESYWQTGQTEDALHEWEDLHAENLLHDPEILLRMARYYHQTADFPREANILRTGIDFAPDWVEFHWRLGLLTMAESPLEAIPLFERAQTLDPQSGYPLSDLVRSLDRASLVDSPAYHLTVAAQSLASLGEWLLARQALERAVASDPEYAAAWALLGEARQQTGAPDALEALNRALRLDPLDTSAHAYLGLYWQRQNEFSRAAQFFRRAAELEPDNPFWLISLAEVTLAGGDVSGAYVYSVQATQAAPLNALAWRNLALFCLRTEACLREDGLPAALTARNIDPDDWRNADTLGQVWMALGADENARDALNQAIELAPGEAAPRFHLGLLYLRRGETDLARQNMQDALSLDPDGPLVETIQRVMSRYLP